MYGTIKAIETEYNGCVFKSRLEARYAVFFDVLGIKWEYEHEGFWLKDGSWYLPDFRLKVNCRTTDENGYVWAEVKGVDDYFEIPFSSRRKIELFDKPLIVLGSLNSVSRMLSFEFIDGDDYPATFSIYNGEPWITGEDHKQIDSGDAFKYAIECAKHARFEFGQKPNVVPYSFFKKPTVKPSVIEFLNCGKKIEIDKGVIAPW